MPWKGEKDPYKIWLSEIILQQTRVEQGLAYYHKIVSRFPTVTELAAADDEEVFKLWEGLGYYSRCRNLLHTARKIAWELGGSFPQSYEQILELKGIGSYTAAAIASFAYDLPYAVVDGNVLRVLSRYFGKSSPIDCLDGRQFYNKLAQQLLPKQNSAAYNQAIMDFGAIVCKPQLPQCQCCVMATNCVALKKGWVNKLPIKTKKLERKKRWFYYFIFSIHDHLLVRKRTEKDIWHNLFEFYLHESPADQNWTNGDLSSFIKEEFKIEHFVIANVSRLYSQQLTHQNLSGKFVTVELADVPEKLAGLQKVKRQNISTLAFPKFITQHLKTL